MTPAEAEHLRRRVEYYTFGVPHSVQDSLILEILSMIDEQSDRSYEDGRRDVLDELADIVVALETAANSDLQTESA